MFWLHAKLIVCEQALNYRGRGITSLSLGQYSKTSVWYFPVQSSLSVNKLLLLYFYYKLYCLRDILNRLIFYHDFKEIFKCPNIDKNQFKVLPNVE
jgi:hypothetical protein